MEEEPYLLELVRYPHLNPLRAKVVPDLRSLDRVSLDRPQRPPGDRPPVLASGEFVTAVLRAAPAAAAEGGPPRVPLETLAARLGVAVPTLFGGTQTRAAGTARQLLAYVWVEVLGRRASALARALGQSRGNVCLAAQRGAVHAARWQAEIPIWCR